MPEIDYDPDVTDEDKDKQLFRNENDFANYDSLVISGNKSDPSTIAPKLWSISTYVRILPNIRNSKALVDYGHQGTCIIFNHGKCVSSS